MYALFIVEPPSTDVQYQADQWARFRLVLDETKKQIPPDFVLANNVVLLELAKHSNLLGKLIYNAQLIHHKVLYLEKTPITYLHR